MSPPTAGTGTAKAAIISGASSGIGRAVAIALSQAGCRVTVCGRDRVRVAETEEIVGGYGIAADLTAPGACERVVDEHLQTFGRLDILVNTAGAVLRRSIPETSWEQWEGQIAVNLRTTVELTRCALGHFSTDRGLIVNVASTAALRAAPGIAAYAASKAAIVAYTLALREELLPTAIAACVICPDSVSTPMSGSSTARLEASDVASLITALIGLPNAAVPPVLLLAPR